MSLIHIFTLGFRPQYLIVGLLAGCIIGFYGFFRLGRLLSHYDISKKASLIFRIILTILIIISCFNIQSLVTLLLAYLFFASVLADIIRIIYSLIIGNKNIKILNYIPKLHSKDILALIIFILIIAGGIYGMNHIEQTDYYINTNKTNETYTILFISDIHYNTVQNPQLLKENIGKMNDVKPDIVILGGDIVDERSSNKDMHEVFSVLSQINSTYGTYFIYGNHDTQPNLNDTNHHKREYSNEELTNTIKANNITILNDEKVTINNNLTLIGRADASFNDQVTRADTSKLLRNINPDKFIIMLDHQPLDAQNNSELGVDLVISGHTHGGQVFPFGLVFNLTGTLNYGEYTFGNMKQIVSSGYAGWGFPLRNEAKCEYVVIHVN
ncbi:MAG: metallophosphoesterase [archaeon]|nr:metallophosphoesterase [archaeon]